MFLFSHHLASLAQVLSELPRRQGPLCPLCQFGEDLGAEAAPVGFRALLEGSMHLAGTATDAQLHCFHLDSVRDRENKSKLKALLRFTSSQKRRSNTPAMRAATTWSSVAQLARVRPQTDGMEKENSPPLTQFSPSLSPSRADPPSAGHP